MARYRLLHAQGVDEWITTRLLSVIGSGWHPAGLILLLTGFLFACRLLMPWIPATLLLSLALVPAAPSLGLNRGWWASSYWWPRTPGSIRA